jgi:hypothetical protein
MRVEIPAREGDDEQFLRMVRRVLLGTLAGAEDAGATLVRIDGWFGARYLEGGAAAFPPERLEAETAVAAGGAGAGRRVVLTWSGNTARQLTGSIMVHAVGEGWDGGWHASFVREEKGWSFRKGTGIGPSQFAALVERGRD